MAVNNDYNNLSAEDAAARLNEILFSGDPNADISNAQLEDIQTLLKIAGYDAGTPDGYEGPNTGNALALFLYDKGNPSYNDANPEGRANAEIVRIVETYADAGNVQKYQQMFGPIRYAADIAPTEVVESSAAIARLLSEPRTEANTISLQTELTAVGLAPGSIDGDWGPNSAGATLQYLGDDFNTLLTMNSDNLEFILSKADPQDLENFRTQLSYSPEFYDLLKAKIDEFGGDPDTASSEQLIAVQQLMTAAGLYDRGIDGQTGPGTRGGIAAFNELERPVEREPLQITITPDDDVEPDPSLDTDDGPEGTDTTLIVADADTADVETDEVSPVVLQDIFDRLAAIDPEIVKLASVNVVFTHGNVMRSVEAEAAYQTGFDDDSTVMRELSELEIARMAARETYELPFRYDVFSAADIEQMLVEIERMENGIHPQTDRPIREVEINGQTYLISSANEEGCTMDFNTCSQVIPEQRDIALNDPAPGADFNYTA